MNHCSLIGQHQRIAAVLFQPVSFAAFVYPKCFRSKGFCIPGPYSTDGGHESRATTLPLMHVLSIAKSQGQPGSRLGLGDKSKLTSA